MAQYGPLPFALLGRARRSTRDLRRGTQRPRTNSPDNVTVAMHRRTCQTKKQGQRKKTNRTEAGADAGSQRAGSLRAQHPQQVTCSAERQTEPCRYRGAPKKNTRSGGKTKAVATYNSAASALVQLDGLRVCDKPCGSASRTVRTRTAWPSLRWAAAPTDAPDLVLPSLSRARYRTRPKRAGLAKARQHHSRAAITQRYPQQIKTPTRVPVETAAPPTVCGDRCRPLLVHARVPSCTNRRQTKIPLNGRAECQRSAR